MSYGYDTSCTDDLYPGRTSTGTVFVIEAIYRRLTTRRGSVVDAPNDGIDVRDFLQTDGTPRELAAIEGQIRAELSKDDRIEPGSLIVSAKLTGENLAIRVGGLTSDADSFSLVLAVSGVTVDMLDDGVF